MGNCAGILSQCQGDEDSRLKEIRMLEAIRENKEQENKGINIVKKVKLEGGNNSNSFRNMLPASNDDNTVKD